MGRVLEVISVIISLAVAVAVTLWLGLSDGSFVEKGTVFSFTGALVFAGMVFFVALSVLLFVSGLIEISEAKKRQTGEKPARYLTKEGKK